MKRILYGWILFLTAVAALCVGGVVWAIYLGIFAVLGGNEYLDIVRAKGMRPSVRIVRGMIVAFFAMAALPQFAVVLNLPFQLPPDYGITHFPLLLTVGVCISFFRLLFREEQPPATGADIATTILGFVYVGWMPAYMILLRNLVPHGTTDPVNALQQPGLAYVWVSLFIIFATDVFAYYAGKFFGKNPLYPAISPKKTVEGAVGGLVASIFWASLVVYLCDTHLFPSHPFRMNLWQAPFMGALVSIGCQLGDLCESLLKRDAGMKDSGTMIPGHGGVLDRGDGLIFAAPICYYWITGVVLGQL